MSRTIKVFLGGTCNESTWRDELIPLLACDYFNPVVDDWTPECQAEEIRQRAICDYTLYVITPAMSGVYSIAELVDDAHMRPGKTVFCWLNSDGVLSFTCGQRKSMAMVGNLVASRSVPVFRTITSVAEYLNTRAEMATTF